MFGMGRSCFASLQRAKMSPLRRRLRTFWLGESLQVRWSTPTRRAFTSNIEFKVTILNDYLYITGGQFSQLVNGTIAMNGPSAAWPCNWYPQTLEDRAVLTSLPTVMDTLSLSLKESWVNSTVQFKVTNQTAPSFNRAAFWRDPNQPTAYLWGGWARRGNLPTTTELWQFTADDDGSGEWSRPDPANPDALMPLMRTNGASTATCNGKALYIGGYQSNMTDSRLETASRLPTPGMLTYDMETGMWANISTAPGLNRYGTSLYGAAACAENLGRNGLFFPISGQLADVLPGYSQINNAQFMMGTANLTFYDVENDKWYWQQTSGDNPDTRGRHCVAGVQSSNGTYEMSVIPPICSLPALTTP